MGEERWRDERSKMGIDRHGIISTVPSVRLDGDPSASALQKLPSNLGSDGRMTRDEQEIQQRLSLILCDVVAISLRKGQEASMPQDGETVDGSAIGRIDGFRIDGFHRRAGHGRRPKAKEMKDQGIDDLIWQRVPLLQ